MAACDQPEIMRTEQRQQSTERPEPYLRRLVISYVAAPFKGSNSLTAGRNAAMPGSVTAYPKCHRHSSNIAGPSAGHWAVSVSIGTDAIIGIGNSMEQACS